MPYTFEIRPLSSLPWPPRLGKHGRKRQLEKALKAHLGDDYYSPDANRHALETDSVYRDIVRRELEATGWDRGMVDVALEAAEIAGRAPLLSEPLPSTMVWADWARPHRGQLDEWVCSWLISPPAIVEPFDGGVGFEDGRHRITYLRLHCGPTTEVLVSLYRDDAVEGV